MNTTSMISLEIGISAISCFINTYPAIQAYYSQSSEKGYYFVDRFRTGETRHSYSDRKELVSELKKYVLDNYKFGNTIRRLD